MLTDFRLADPEFVGFVPRNATEAVIKFRRLQKQGLSPFRYPEVLCELANQLKPEEIDKLNEWIICPQGVPETGMDAAVISEENEKVHTMIAAAQDCVGVSTQSEEKSEEENITTSTCSRGGWMH